MMNCAARAAIALMDKSQAAAHTQLFFLLRLVRIEAFEAERENFCLFGIISISLSLRCISARQKSLFAP
jgi:hypothetical protein